MINIAVIDDDEIYRNEIEKQVDKILQDKKMIGKIISLSSCKDLAIENIDIVLLDICFPDGDGIKFAQHIQRTNPNICIIFISAYLEKATEVYEVSHIYFVYKEQMSFYLPKAISKAIENHMENEKSVLKVHWKNTHIQVRQSDILYIEKNGRRVDVITNDGKKYSTYQKFDELLIQCEKNILRVHMSYAVNLDYVKEFHREYIILNNGSYIAVSRKYWKMLQNKILDLFH